MFELNDNWKFLQLLKKYSFQASFFIFENVPYSHPILGWPLFINRLNVTLFKIKCFSRTQSHSNHIIKSSFLTWPAWLSWMEHCPINWRVTGLVPSQATYPGCGFSPRLGHVLEGNQPMFLSHLSLSLSLSLSLYLSIYLSPSLSESNEKMSLGED